MKSEAYPISFYCYFLGLNSFFFLHLIFNESSIFFFLLCIIVVQDSRSFANSLVRLVIFVLFLMIGELIILFLVVLMVFRLFLLMSAVGKEFNN